MPAVLFIDHANRILGGAEINLIELAEAWADSPAEHQWQAVVACATGGPLEAACLSRKVPTAPHFFAKSLNEFRLVGDTGWGQKLGRAWGAWRELRSARARLNLLLEKTRPGAVVTCTNKDHLCAAPLCHRMGIPHFWWVNDIWSVDFFPRASLRVLARSARKNRARLVAVSEYARAAALHCGLPSDRVRTALNAIPVARYRAEAAARFEWPFPIQGPVIGCVGRLTPWKGQEFFLALAERHLSANPVATFVLIGQSFNEDQPYESRLRERVRANPRLSRGVQFLPFQQPIAPALAALNALVHCSLRPEPFGRVILEAMAVGASVIAARAGGVPEIISHGETGWLAEPGNLEEYHTLLSGVLNNSAASQKMTGQALSHVEKAFDLSRLLAQFQSFLTVP